MNESMLSRVHPDLYEMAKAVLPVMEQAMNLHDIPAARKALTQMMQAAQAQAPAIEGVSVTNTTVPGPEGAPEVPVRIYRPQNQNGVLPGLLWIHGGGFVLGDLDQDDATLRSHCLEVDCVIVSVDYRLAPEHPFPAPLEDCYAALKWFAGNARELGADKDRIAIAGASAGGGLTAGLALLTRDRGEIKLLFQMPIYPMIDDRNTLPASETRPDFLVWTREDNLIGWQSYLGDKFGTSDISPYAAPARATDLKGLPPAYIPVGTLDTFRDESIAYAHRLMQADVSTEFHVYPNVFHGFDSFIPNAAISKRFVSDYLDALKRMFNNLHL